MDTELDRRTALAALLSWQEAMGATAAVGDTAIDWLSRADLAPGAAFDLAALSGAMPEPGSEPSPQMFSANAAATTSSPGFKPVPKSAVAVSAPPNRTLRPLSPTSATAVKARSLSELEAELSAFEGCSLKSTAKSLCLFRGAAKARLMIVGDAPGREDDLEGKPFAGRGGQLLDKILAAIGITTDQVHITNAVYWRPPGNRAPTPAETVACAPFMVRQIELVEPDVLMVLGGVAAKQILDAQESITGIRGHWFETISKSRTIRTMPSHHPTYLLQTPLAKRQAWRDFLAVKDALSR